MGDLSKNFSKRELQCPHCGLFIANGELVATLQAIRDEVGLPVKINSGTRCAEHNKKVGGVSASPHMYGYAADIAVPGWSNSRLGDFIKKLYRDGKLPFLQYCYKIQGSTNTAVHVSVDKLKKRNSPFGW